jgi:predicted MFS family arabinose efflux permease
MATEAGAPDVGAAAERDLRAVLVVQGIRAFAYGFGSVLLGVTLAAGGLSSAQVGVVFTSMLAGMALTSIGVGLWGDRIGRRRLYAVSFAVMAAAGMVFAFTRWLPALVLASLTGTLSTDPNESGPITSLEQAMIGQAPAAGRVRVFGRYNAVAYLTGAVGSLAAGGPEALRHIEPSLPADRRFLLVIPALAVLCLGMALRLSPAVEPEPGERAGAVRIPLGPSRRTVFRLASLFALDAFGGGFVVQAFLVFWFRRRFGAGLELMGLVFFGAGLLQAGSSLVAARVASRVGLLNVMVFTHLPSNLLLAAVPFAPNLGTGIALLLSRFALSQMDVPTRQAYVVAMVEPGERTAAAATTNLARYAVRPGGPVVAGALMQNVALGAPFVVAGTIKVAYDGLLFWTFRHVPIEDVPVSPRRSAS